ncbi:Brwd1 [Symbiodinium sp. CCMP2456]|nr:Brwd1 [Symbiodinium sp. CCMP2456]
MSVLGCRAYIRLASAVLLAGILPCASQRAFKISSSACTLTASASSCQVAAAGDAALQIVFNANAATALTLDMSSTTTCSASGIVCPQVFMVTSDHAENVVKLSKCSYYKQADYSTHLLTYTFMNVGASSAFAVHDDHNVGRAVVPPGSIRECFCHCSGTCATGTNNRLYCTHISTR